jgi:hypothetical protein
MNTPGLIAGSVCFSLHRAARIYRLRFTLAAVALAMLATNLQAQTTASAPASPAPPINIYDGFETPNLTPLWEPSRLEPHSIAMETQTVRAGHQAIAITVRPNDMFEAGQHGSADSERDELLEARALTAREGHAYEQTFSMFFPADFPIVPTRLVIAQWKQYCGSDDLPCSDDSPVLALRYIGGTLLITQDLDKQHIILYQQHAEFRGRWLDFKIRTRFSSTDTGRIKVWLGDKLLVDHTGITADAETPQTGYAGPSRFFFKMGLYRNRMKEPMTVYIDEYRKREIPDAVL